MESTPLTLLERLRQPDDSAAWQRFVRLYAPLLVSWARQQGFQAADAADVAQEVMLKLLRLLPTYQRGPHQRFRGWLFEITRNQCRDYRRRRATRSLPNDDGLHDVDVAPEAPSLDEADEREYRLRLIRAAQDEIRADFQERTWLAYLGVVVQGRAAAAVAAELGMSEMAVYLARHRVLTRLRQELEGLLD